MSAVLNNSSVLGIRAAPAGRPEGEDDAA